MGALRLRRRGREPRRRRLRSVARQALGVRRDARGSADPHAGGAPRDRAARRRHEPRLPRGRARPSGVRGRIHPYRVPRRASRGLDADGGQAPPRYRRRPGRARAVGPVARRDGAGRRMPRSPRRGRHSAPGVPERARDEHSQDRRPRRRAARGRGERPRRRARGAGRRAHARAGTRRATARAGGSRSAIAP